MKKVMLFGLALGLASTAPLAQEFQQENFYVGGGIGSNSVSGWDSAIGLQVFAGYTLDMVPLGPFTLAVEIGYMDSGTFERNVGGQVIEADVSGLWTNAVFTLPFNETMHFIGRAGHDFGDDDGLMVGVGLGFKLAPRFDLRGEFVTRDNVDSLQANVVYRF